MIWLRRVVERRMNQRQSHDDSPILIESSESPQQIQIYWLGFNRLVELEAGSGSVRDAELVRIQPFRNKLNIVSTQKKVNGSNVTCDM